MLATNKFTINQQIGTFAITFGYFMIRHDPCLRNGDTWLGLATGGGRQRHHAGRTPGPHQPRVCDTQVPNSRFPPTYAATSHRKGTDPGDGGVAISSSLYHVLPHEGASDDRSPPHPLVLPSKSPLTGRGGVERGQQSPQDSQVRTWEEGKRMAGWPGEVTR